MLKQRLQRRRGLSQQELANRIGISRPQLANGLQGRFPLSDWASARLREALLAQHRGSMKKIATKSPQLPYERTAEENRVIEAFRARREKSKPLPEQVVEYGNDGVPSLREGHPDRAVGATLTMEALGLTRVPELSALLHHVVDLTQKDRKVDEHGINQVLAQIAAIEPRDGIEAMLATQMVTVHNAMMKSARSLRGSDTIPKQDSNGNLVNKLARTFASQVEALKRHRSKGEQKVVVEHVTVNEGGQAIVGAVQHRGEGSE